MRFYSDSSRFGFCFSLLLFANVSFFSSNAVSDPIRLFPFTLTFFYFVLLFICLCHYLNVQIVNYKDI